MAALGRRSGEARRKRKTEPTDHGKAHDTLVDSLQSPSAIARIQAAKELLSRKPADPEPEPPHTHGVNLSDLISLALRTGVVTPTHLASLVAANPPTPPAEKGHLASAPWLRGVPPVGGPMPVFDQQENGLSKQEEPMDGVGGFFKEPDSDAFVSESDRRLAEMIAANEQAAYEGRVMVELGLDEGGGGNGAE
jgi:hypothetical protein